jgi:transglutaminase-like putative cysteine protease
VARALTVLDNVREGVQSPRSMDRRTFLKLGAAAASGLATLDRLAPFARAETRTFDPQPGAWRTWMITTRIEVLKASGTTRVWMPVPAVDGDYQTALADRWSGNAKTINQETDGKSGATMLYAEFPNEPAPVLEVVSRVRTRDRAVDWSAQTPKKLHHVEARRWTAPTAQVPTDGIVAETAKKIAEGKTTDRERVAAVYDWVIDNMWREPTVRGCGVGDVKTILETQRFGGKCGDINGVFVGLVRALGSPARAVYGLRVAPSRFGYKALGPSTPIVTKAQHCRAEVFLSDHGWVGMDPADVAKVAREEAPDWLAKDDPIVTTVRPKLFGAWEGNWIAYNTAHDVTLPGSTQGPLGFLMYPQAETAQARVDCLAPDEFKYTITAAPA